jgi:hydrogenase maturation factor
MRSMRHHKVYVIRVPKYVVTTETNVFAAMCKVTCLRIIECGRLIRVCLCVCVCTCGAYVVIHVGISVISTESRVRLYASS